MTTEQTRFEDILFDNTREVVESRVETKTNHVTTLIVDGDVAAVRTITSEGTTYKFS